jgi:GxxExxY protein
MPLEYEELTYSIIGAAMEVHRELGRGYAEAVYQEAMEIELQVRGVAFVAQPKVTIEFKGHILRQFYIPDFIVNGAVVVEMKAHSEPLSKSDEKQSLNSLKTADKRVGLLLNFGRASLEHKRFIGFD